MTVTVPSLLDSPCCCNSTGHTSMGSLTTHTHLSHTVPQFFVSSAGLNNGSTTLRLQRGQRRLVLKTELEPATIELFHPMHRTRWNDKKFFPFHRVSHWWMASTASFLNVAFTRVRHVCKKFYSGTAHTKVATIAASLLVGGFNYHRER